MDDNSLKVSSNEMKLVDFRILKQEEDSVYEGINISKVREIIRAPQLTNLPGTPDFIECDF
ncbi:MAG: hypothetical protein SPLUMA1_SPLUMAMAG1_00080 [uncultured Sulfurimonas sp.]|nr:MAG: hypothetical protein SPLUMA1_SPLUMAMAG1_00080 [uncultured Sulfurimonas sp.]